MAPCILCGKEAPLKMRMPVDQKKFTPTKFGSIHHCGACDLGFVYPRPTVEETNEFYQLDAYYTQGKSHFVEVRETFWDKVLLHLSWRTDYSRDLTEVLVSEVKKGGTILDVGCGSGQLLAKLSDRGYRCIGVERDANTISVRAACDIAAGEAARPLEFRLVNSPGTYAAVTGNHRDAQMPGLQRPDQPWRH